MKKATASESTSGGNATNRRSYDWAAASLGVLILLYLIAITRSFQRFGPLQALFVVFLMALVVGLLFPLMHGRLVLTVRRRWLRVTAWGAFAAFLIVFYLLASHLPDVIAATTISESLPITLVDGLVPAAVNVVARPEVRIQGEEPDGDDAVTVWLRAVGNSKWSGPYAPKMDGRVWHTVLTLAPTSISVENGYEVLALQGDSAPDNCHRCQPLVLVRLPLAASIADIKTQDLSARISGTANAASAAHLFREHTGMREDLGLLNVASGSWFKEVDLRPAYLFPTAVTFAVRAVPEDSPGNPIWLAERTVIVPSPRVSVTSVNNQSTSSCEVLEGSSVSLELGTANLLPTERLWVSEQGFDNREVPTEQRQQPAASKGANVWRGELRIGQGSHFRFDAAISASDPVAKSNALRSAPITCASRPRL